MRSRFREALLHWLRLTPPSAGVESLFVDPLLTVSSLDPAEVGRQKSRGEAILDTAEWLAASGWSDVSAGNRQQYAEWLLLKREAYERQGAPT